MSRNDHGGIARRGKGQKRTKKEEAVKHPQRNIGTRALGTQPTVEADFYNEAIRPGDAVILCAEGLWGEVSEEEGALMSLLDEAHS